MTWTIVGSPIRRGKHYYVTAVCDCGEQREVRRDNVESGHSTCCKTCGFARARESLITPLLERFWSRVNKTSGCWEWQGQLSQAGYGNLSSGGDNRRTLLAHRFSWEVHNGAIEAETLDHLCMNRKCVNPAHLEPVSRSENSRRAVENTRQTGGGHMKVTDSVAKAIIDDRESGLLIRELAGKHKLGIATVSKVVCGRHWTSRQAGRAK